MKILIRFSILVGIVLNLYSCDHHQTSIESFNGDYSEGDTAFINIILHQISEGEFSNSDSAYKYLSLATELSENCNYMNGMATALFLQGNMLYRENKYEEALNCYSSALNLTEKMDSPLLKAKCLERMASVNLTLGDDHLSLKLYYESLALFEQANDKEGIAKVYNIIGVSKSSQGEYDTAIQYFQKAIELNEEVGNQTGLIHNNGNLAFMYHKMGNTEKAKAIYLNLVPKLNEMADSINLAVVYYHLSIFSETASQTDSTLFYLRKAMLVSTQLADTSILTTLYGKIGEIHLNHQQYDSASYLLTISAKMAHAIDDYVTEKMAIKLLLTIDTLNGNYKKATERYAQLIALNDSVYNQRLRNNLEASELRYVNQKKSNLIEIQKIDLASAKRQKQFLIFLFLLLALTSVMLVLLIILVKRNNKRKQELLSEKLRINKMQLENARKTEEISKLKIEKIEKEIKIKEKEQVSDALALEQKNDLLALVNKKFRDAMEENGSISLAELNGLVSAIKTQISESTDSDLFNQKFNLLHTNFFDKLKKTHPDLTKSELKFCAYLKLNLTGSQIAKIANVTTEAIRKTRHRIRKKINLSTKDSLEDYISEF
ncbi:MAG: tetratricopeptide repeat protein [Bacteroidales bacterium]